MYNVVEAVGTCWDCNCDFACPRFRFSPTRNFPCPSFYPPQGNLTYSAVQTNSLPISLPDLSFILIWRAEEVSTPVQQYVLDGICL
jgi:hypothetical protein